MSIAPPGTGPGEGASRGTSPVESTVRAGRAHASRPRRVRYVVAAGLCVVAIVAMLVFGLRKNIVYFRTVSEAVHSRARDGHRTFRLGGDVIPASVHTLVDGRVAFRVTDGKNAVDVVQDGDEPALFRSNVAKGQVVPIVMDGHWSAESTFVSTQILIKHGSDYEPPKKNFEQS